MTALDHLWSAIARLIVAAAWSHPADVAMTRMGRDRFGSRR